MIINASLTRAMLNAQTNDSAILFLLTHLRASPEATESEENDTKRILASADPLAALWKCGVHMVINEDARWFITPFGETVRVAYQHKIRGSWTTFGVDLLEVGEPEAVLNVIRIRTESGFPADELSPGTQVKGYLDESYRANGAGMWNIGRIMLGLHPTGVFRWATLERLYEVAQHHKLYADIVNDFGIQHDRDYLNKIVDGKWVVEDANAVAVLNSYFTSMLQFFFKRGFWYQDTIDGGRIDVRTEEGSLYFNGANATTNTINLTYLTENTYEVRESVWEFGWDCNNTEYFPVEAPIEALLAFHARVDQEHSYKATGRGYQLEDIHKVQRAKREPTEWEQEK